MQNREIANAFRGLPVPEPDVDNLGRKWNVSPQAIDIMGAKKAIGWKTMMAFGAGFHSRDVEVQALRDALTQEAANYKYAIEKYAELRGSIDDRKDARNLKNDIYASEVNCGNCGANKGDMHSMFCRQELILHLEDKIEAAKLVINKLADNQMPGYDDIYGTEAEVNVAFEYANVEAFDMSNVEDGSVEVFDSRCYCKFRIGERGPEEIIQCKYCEILESICGQQ